MCCLRIWAYSGWEHIDGRCRLANGRESTWGFHRALMEPWPLLGVLTQVLAVTAFKIKRRKAARNNRFAKISCLNFGKCSAMSCVAQTSIAYKQDLYNQMGALCDAEEYPEMVCMAPQSLVPLQADSPIMIGWGFHTREGVFIQAPRHRCHLWAPEVFWFQIPFG
jgi:hypothetical protein